MTLHRHYSSLLPAVLLCLVGASLHAQSPDDWRFETLRLHDERNLQGVLLSQRETEWEFAEIRRPKGRPMYAVIHAVSPGEVAKFDRRPDEDHAQLLARYDAFRNRARIELGRMEDVKLQRTFEYGRPLGKYAGRWFTLLSTAEEETTRRSIVRLEQWFRAYRQLLPPRSPAGGDLEIRLFGAGLEYQEALRGWNMEMEHPAFFSSRRNLAAAGSDLDRIGEELALSRKENENTLRDLKRLEKEFQAKLVIDAEELKKNMFLPEEIEAELRQRRTIWRKQRTEIETRIAETNRRNEGRFNAAAGAMFARLNHEAFHAYLENYVYPHREYSVPRWLNEGLAQVFERAQLDADTLRIDAPAAGLLADLQRDLKSDRAISLAELLNHTESAFLIAHDASSQEARRHYLYAWGLAYYLAFHQQRLGTPQLDAYVAHDAARLPAVERFERLMGRPLAEFEKQWRADMLAMKRGD